MRQLLDYDRLDDFSLLESINALYRDCWESLHNFFLPSAKLEATSHEGAKVKRKCDKPLTPCGRRLASSDVSAAAKRRLKRQRAVLSPFDLHRRLEEGLRPMQLKPP